MAVRAGRHLLLVAMAALVSASMVAWAEPENDPLRDLPSYASAIWRMVISLVAIIVALLIAAGLLSRWLKRYPHAHSGRIIQVVERHRLEPRKSIYLVRIADEYLLLGVSENGLQTLAGGPIDQETIEVALRRADQNTGRSAPSSVPPTPAAVDGADQSGG
jgi:flagellar biosynthetic protein FliO